MTNRQTDRQTRSEGPRNERGVWGARERDDCAEGSIEEARGGLTFLKSDQMSLHIARVGYVMYVLPLRVREARG
jgi:hypothetical protein